MSGNFSFDCRTPLASRVPSHVSSILTYTYPASFMPFDAIASAIPRTALSSTLRWNLFQLFHPMGGVLANPLYLTGSKSLEREIFGAGIVGRSVDTRLAVNTVAGRVPSLGIVTFNPSPDSSAVQSARLSTPLDSRRTVNETLFPSTRPSTINIV